METHNGTIAWVKLKVAQSCPTLCSPWNSPGQNTGVGSLSLLQGIFPTQRLKPGLPHWGRFFISWATREAQEYWNGYPIPSPVDLPDPGIEPGSPALQVDFLPTELWGKPILLEKRRKWRTWRFKWSLRKDSNSFPLSNRWEVKRWVSEDKTGITELPCWSSG